MQPVLFLFISVYFGDHTSSNENSNVYFAGIVVVSSRKRQQIFAMASQ